ncbi:MAG: sulfotransferase domain-containing protein [Leptolyngbya sp. SIO4C1]|nr:sulfotransferase domain-containing protein [Leptolyngbya sp. SIO4C1]
MVLPNFLIIGAAKAGTTSIAQYMKQHPQIYISPVKEPYFFSFEGQTPNFQGPGDSDTFSYAVTRLADYEHLFDKVNGETAIGEASVSYLHIPETAERISQHLSQVKILVILRDPAERAYAHFMHQIRDGHESTIDFSEALQVEDQRIQDNWMFPWHYKRNGFYFEQLSTYLSIFDARQIKVWLYEDLQKDAAGLLKEIFYFLGVDDTFTPDLSVRYNISGIPKNRTIFNLIDKPNLAKKVLRPLLPQKMRYKLRKSALEKPLMSKDIRNHLVNIYRDDILKLQDLINRDLSNWLS